MGIEQVKETMGHSYCINRRKEWGYANGIVNFALNKSPSVST